MIMGSFVRRMTLKTRITITFVLLMVGAMGVVIAAEQLDYDDLRAYVISKGMQDEAQQL